MSPSLGVTGRSSPARGGIDDPRRVRALSALEPRPSISRNAAIRVVSDVVGMAFALVTATVTARYLSTAEKGRFSTLVFLEGIIAQLCGLGLSEAAIIFVRQGRVGTRELLRGQRRLVALAAPIMALTEFCLATAVLHPRSVVTREAIAISSLDVILVGVSGMLSWALLAHERMAAISVIHVVNLAVTALIVALLVAPGAFGLRGAVVGNLIGSGTLLTGTVLLARREGGGPGHVRSLQLRPLIRFGVPIAMSSLLLALAGRFDLVVVLEIRGAAQAGVYSVALAVGSLAVLSGQAISYATLPRLAGTRERQLEMLASIVRLTFVVSIAVAAAIASINLWLVPLAFGSRYAGAVAPAFVLLAANALTAFQWTSSRALTALGSRRAIVQSFSVSFLLMVSLDLITVGPYGLMGAAISSLVASATGAGVSVYHLTRRGVNLASLVPKAADGRYLLAALSRLRP